jgi:enamine deaminase RidA (YjgF/YER057c/UK114 family)
MCLMTSTISSSHRPRSSGDRTALWISGHDAHPSWEYFQGTTTWRSPGEQTADAFRAVLAELGEAGLGVDDLTSVTEYVPMSAIAAYPEIEQARNEFLGHRSVPVRTKVVDRLLKPGAAIEIEVSAHPGATLTGTDSSRWHRSAVAEADEIVTLPTMVPIDEEGRIVDAGDVVGQYRYCLERAAMLLEHLGLSLADVVRTLDYATPETVDKYPHDLRIEMFGPLYPCSFGINNTGMHVPGVLTAVDMIASRLPAKKVQPAGWNRYDGLSYSPAIKIGRRLVMSGTVALDQPKATPMYVGRPAKQAELIYENIATMLAAAGGTFNHLVKCNEYLVPGSVDSYAEISAARRALLGDAQPALTTVVCTRMQWPVFQMECVPTAILDA